MMDGDQWMRPMMMSGRGRRSDHNRSELSDQNRSESRPEPEMIFNCQAATDLLQLEGSQKRRPL